MNLIKMCSENIDRRTINTLPLKAMIPSIFFLK